MGKTYTVEKDYQNTRFDKWFKAKIINLPQSLIEKIIRLNKVKINRKRVKSSYRVKCGDIVEVYDISKFKENYRPKISKYKPSNKEVNTYDDFIIENNENFIIINKPAGIAVQSGTKSFKNIIDILKDSKYFVNRKPYIVHRLDKDREGLMVITKTNDSYRHLKQQFKDRNVSKLYYAMVKGNILFEKLSQHLPLGLRTLAITSNTLTGEVRY